MNSNKVNEVKKLLNIKGSVDEGITKYKELKKKFNLLMRIALILLIVAAVLSVLMVMDIVNIQEYFSPFIVLFMVISGIFFSYGTISNKANFYQVVLMLESGQSDINRIKELLQIEKVKDYHKAKRIWRVLRNLYLFLGILFVAFIVLYITANILNGIDWIGIIFGLFAFILNINMFNAFKYRQSIYSVGIILEEDK